MEGGNEMGQKSAIEWTETTWNPLTGCTKISPGCKNCYAERMALRLRAMGQPNYTNGFQLTLHEQLLTLPLRWKSPQTIFVNSMSDMFHEDVPSDFVVKAFEVMRTANWHNFQILTKRAKRLIELNPFLSWSPNIWMGVSVENADYLSRIDYLRRTSAAVKFLSLEPLLGPLDRLKLEGIDWVIAGGESGPGAREMKSHWVKSIHNQCARANIPFFFKQWGKKQFNPDSDDPTISKDHPNHAKGGCQLDGKIYRNLPAPQPLSPAI
jgi:protein gp37